MSDAARKTPQPVREDLYFAALEAFIRTSAGYLDVDKQVPGQGISRDHCQHMVLGGELR